MRESAVVCAACGRAVQEFGGKHWSIGTMLGLIIATVFMPPVGLVFGVMGFRTPARKAQGAVLLTVAIFMSLLLTAIILGL
jgi:hypothetical protein